VGLGELLWDMLPEGKQLGGAPANFAFHAAQLGNQAIIASRIGNDAAGKDVLAGLQQNNLSSSYLQHDDMHPTGTVDVRIDVQGQPSFMINETVAWDFLEFTDEWQALAARAEVICFGSLAQRHRVAQTTIHQFLNLCRQQALKIFDVNLRQSYFSRTAIYRSLELANLVKVNAYEFHFLTDLFSIKGATEIEQARRILEIYNLDLICITKGAHGSLLVNREEAIEHPGIAVKVRDAIGAGDGFTAAMAHHYLRGASLERISEAANRLGSWVATQAGATPKMNQEILQATIR
jgi:fructokinase